MTEERPQSDNAADEARIRSRKKDDRLKSIQDAADLKWVMGDPRGRRFIWRLLTFCRVHNSSFHTNALVMAHNEGTRNVGLFLESETLTACTASFQAMQSEAMKEVTP